MKVAVYTICLNEIKHVDRFMKTASEADYVVILDTGSTDGSVLRLRELGAIVHEETITPWEFDRARNRCLELLPDDVDMCLSIDLDEFPRAGWRKIVDEVWCPGVTRIYYSYSQDDATPFRHDKFHHRRGYEWRHIVHETIYPTIPENYAWAEHLVVEHRPDHEKSRSSYLPLLEEEIRRNPFHDPHYMWLMCEYLARGMYEKTVEVGELTLDKFPRMWNIYRAIVMGYNAHAYNELDDFENEHRMRMMACVEAPRWRDPWMYLAEFYHWNSEWQKSVHAVEQLLSIKEYLKVATASMDPWGAKPYMFAAMSNWKMGNLDDAARYFVRGRKLDPQHEEISTLYAEFLSQTNPASR